VVSDRMPRGVVVINAVKKEALDEAVLLLEKNRFEVEISHVSISRSESQHGPKRMAALDRISVVRGERK
jgi:precorrin-6B methylase 2